MNKSFKIRDAGVAGSFYSRDKLILEREMSMMLEAANLMKTERPIRAIIAPHAGYLYSGGVAARAYAQILNSSYKRVVVIAPSHEDSFTFNSIYPGLGYRTPLGEIQIDNDLAEKLVDASTDIKFDELGHSKNEHSLEVQLPFLQWSLGKFKLIPVSMGKQEKQQIDALVAALSKLLPSDGTLIVASTDLSHMHPQHEAELLDQVAIESIERLEENRLWNDIQSGRTEMCGYGPAIVAMKTAKTMGASKAKVLLYRNSGDITGDMSEVVGYMSAIIY